MQGIISYYFLLNLKTVINNITFINKVLFPITIAIISMEIMTY